MHKLIAPIAVAALLAASATPAANAAVKGVPYKGKTSAGHKVSFTLKGKRALKFTTGVPVTCLSIQGGGAPLTGVQPTYFPWMELPLRNYKHTQENANVSFSWREVTANWTVTMFRTGRNSVSGALRLQYEFLIPKYPIGTFTIYSCLGNMKFTAKAAR
jgi:hypothetical protein